MNEKYFTVPDETLFDSNLAEYEYMQEKNRSRSTTGGRRDGGDS